MVAQFAESWHQLLFYDFDKEKVESASLLLSQLWDMTMRRTWHEAQSQFLVEVEEEVPHPSLWNLKSLEHK
jgi:hypothetical protein